jgi:hypothetical protein
MEENSTRHSFYLLAAQLMKIWNRPQFAIAQNCPPSTREGKEAHRKFRRKKKKQIRGMIDKMKQLQKKPPDKWYEAMNILEQKIVKWLYIHAELQPANSEKRSIRQWLRKVKGKRTAIGIDNGSMMRSHLLQLTELNKNDEFLNKILEFHH